MAAQPKNGLGNNPYFHALTTRSPCFCKQSTITANTKVTVCDSVWHACARLKYSYLCACVDAELLKTDATNCYHVGEAPHTGILPMHTMMNVVTGQCNFCYTMLRLTSKVW